MSELLERLRVALGGDERVVAGQGGAADAQPPSPWHGVDIARHSLGRPVAWVRPRTTAEVQRVVELARAHPTPVVAVGERTAYWNTLHLEGAIALETSGLVGVVDSDLDAGWVRVLAGTPVRVLDDWLRERGHALPGHPDAYGETPVGAMAATGFDSGIGMGRGGVEAMVTGLVVVSGTGARLTTGAAQVLGSGAFIRTGLPDPTGLFLASEGALGVITELWIRPRPLVSEGTLVFTVPEGDDRPAAVVALARELRRPGLCPTFRALRTEEPGLGQPTEVTVELTLEAPLGPSELSARLSWAAEVGERLLGVAPERLEGPIRWAGELGGHGFIQRQVHFAGVDVLLPYPEAARALAAAEHILDEARALPLFQLRRALYAAPGYLNLGLHMAFMPAVDGRPDPTPGVHELTARALERLAPLRVVPYRMGRGWSRLLMPRLEPGYLALIRELKRTLDPDAILHPGASLFPD